ncbi:DUF2760 domain-containing protein [Marinobacterium aestuariivivens]|uniref:DUF2760 domain-containing protein n=1 Tax=Marinobacterium aestuariivivens TaxID=1698799 RepID=A0ABW2A354_9GAMM
MNFDLTAMPTTFDAAHVGLAVLAALFLILYLVKGASDKSAPQTAPEPEAKEQPRPEAKAAPQLREATPDAALQLLSLLQQEARFIDFIQEDLGGFSDADIGAAARVVHEGSRKALNEYFTLAPVRSEEEESRVTLPEGFNAHEVRLTGNVVGKAPFTGTLVHRGWKVTEVKLPKLAQGHDTRVIAPAEVEL